MQYINIDGKILSAAKAGIDPASRTFRYGYGLFETMLVRNGEIDLWLLHWRRLTLGLAYLQFNVPAYCTSDWLNDQVLQTVERNGLEDICRVRLQIFADKGGLFDCEKNIAHFIIECFHLNPEVLSWNENGLIVGLADGVFKSNDALAQFKTTSALVYAVAAQQAKRNKWNDALIVNTHAHIIESTIANIFCVSNNTIYTPPLSEGCVAGVMREYIMTTSPEIGVDIIELPFSNDFLLAADEIFLTNAIRRIKWVGQFQNKKYGSDVSRSFFNSLFHAHT